MGLVDNSSGVCVGGGGGGGRGCMGAFGVREETNADGC